MMQAQGRYATSQEYLEQALGEVSQLAPQDSSLKPLTEEILGSMRNNLPYSLSPEADPDLEYDGQALLDSIDQADPNSAAMLNLDTAMLRKYREEALLDSTVNFDLPVELNDRVLSQLRIFKERVPSTFQRWLERKGRWEQEFSAKLVARGMPQDLIYLAMIESGFNARATSPAAATGIWQFIPSTGRRYGLRVDRFVDERRDPARATDAALDFLSSLYQHFGDWKLAMAAYNCGEGCIDHAIRRAGHNNYWQLPIPNETRNYVPRVFAAAILGKRPSVHGFQYTAWQPLTFDTFTVEGGIPLLKIAEIVHAPADSLILLNPALIKGMTPPAHECWMLRLPSGTRPLFDSAYTSLDRSYQAPQPVRFAHRVKKGETLQRIAAKYGVTIASLKSWNKIKGKKVRTGRTLTVYADDLSTASLPSWQEPPMERRSKLLASQGRIASTPRHKVQRGETLKSIATHYGVTVPDLMTWNDLPSARVKRGRTLSVSAPVLDATLSDIPRTRTLATQTAEASASPETAVAESFHHKVRRGESLKRIAQRYGVTTQELVAWNDLPSARVKPGTSLLIQTRSPRIESSSQPVSTVATPRKHPANDPRTATHKVKRGETVSVIALQYGVSAHDLMVTNGLRGPHVRAGQTLIIPGAAKEVASATTEHARIVRAEPKSDKPDRAVRTTRYIVRPGDSLYSIARAMSTTIDTLKLLNGLNKANLRVGQIIQVPTNG